MDKHSMLQAEELKILKRIDAFCTKHDFKYFLYSGTLLGAVRHQGFIPWDDDIDIAMKRSEYNKLDDLLVAGDFDGEDYYYQSNRLEKFYWSEVSKVRTNTLDLQEDVAKTQEGFNGPWVDIFPYDNVPDDEDLRRKQYKKANRLSKIIEFFLMTTEGENDKGLTRLFKKTVRRINERFYKSYFFLTPILKARYKEITKYNHLETKQRGCICYMGFADYEAYADFMIDSEDFEDLIKLPFVDDEFWVPRRYDKILTDFFDDYMKVPDVEDQQTHNITYNQKD